MDCKVLVFASMTQCGVMRYECATKALKTEMFV